MASKTFAVSSSKSWVAGQVVVSSSSNGSEKNSSNIIITLQGRRTDGGKSFNAYASNFYIKINGVIVATDTNGCTVSGTSWQNILTYSGIIDHNNDGTKSITITVGGNITETSFIFNDTSSTFDLDSIPRYATITKFENIGVTQTTATFSWAADSTIDEVQYQVGTGTWYVANESPNSLVTVTGLVPGASYDIRISVKRQDSQLWTNSDYKKITTTALTNIANASGFSFYIGQDISFDITNPDNNNSICRVYYANNEDNIWTRFNAPFDEISIRKGTTRINLPFSQITDFLYSLTPNSNLLNLKIEFGAMIDGVEYLNSYAGMAKVNTSDSEPIFTSFECKNVDPVTVNILGQENSMYIPCNLGKMQVQINVSDKAVAQNFATIKYYFVTVINPNDSIVSVKMIPYTDDDIILDLDSLNLTIIGEYKVNILARDSRDNASATISRSFYVIDYHTPNTIINASRLNGFDNEILLELTSVYSRLLLNSIAYNEIVSIKYRTQSVEDLIWSDYVELTGDNIIQDGLLDGTIVISRGKNNILTSLSSDYAHNMEFVVTDKLGTYIYPIISLDKGIPNVAESDDGYFAIGMLPDWNSGAKLQVATDIMATDKDGKRKLILEEIKAVQDGLTEAGGALGGYLPLAGGNIAGTLFIQGREYGINKVLWSGGHYMDSGQTATLSESISAQPHGIVLVWSKYDQANGAGVDAEFTFFFIPKHYVTVASGKGMWMSDPYAAMSKYVYIADTTVTGYSTNSTTGTYNSVSYTNNGFILRYVIGV